MIKFKKFANAEAMHECITIDCIDLYNVNTGQYAFCYNEDMAICEYKLSIIQALELAIKATQNDEYWAAYLGVGGLIFDNSLDWCAENFKNDGWLPCDKLIAYTIEKIDNKYKGEKL